MFYWRKRKFVGGSLSTKWRQKFRNAKSFAELPASLVREVADVTSALIGVALIAVLISKQKGGRGRKAPRTIIREQGKAFAEMLEASGAQNK